MHSSADYRIGWTRVINGILHGYGREKSGRLRSGADPGHRGGIGAGPMANVTYYVVVPLMRDEDGALTPRRGEGGAERLTGETSGPGALRHGRQRRRGCLLADGRSRHGRFADAVVIANFGEVDMDALAG